MKTREKQIVNKITKFPCIFLDEKQRILHMDAIIKEFSFLVNIEADKEDIFIS